MHDESEESSGRAAKRKRDERPESGRSHALTAKEIGDLNNRLFFRLLQVANVMHNSATQAVEPLGLTSQQWSVLGSVSRFEGQGGATVSDLSAHLRMSRQNLWKILQHLEKAGLTQRVPAPDDLRQRLVVMTDQGVRFWKSLQKIAIPYHESALRNFSVAERIEFVELITRLERGLRE